MCKTMLQCKGNNYIPASVASTGELGVSVASVMVMGMESTVGLGTESDVEVGVVLDVKVSVTFTAQL